MNFDKTIKRINEILVNNPYEYQALYDLFEITKLLRHERIKEVMK